MGETPQAGNADFCILWLNERGKRQTGTALPPPPSALFLSRAAHRPARPGAHESPVTVRAALSRRAKAFMLRSALLCHLLAGSVQQGLATSVECLPYRSDEALLDFLGANPQRFLYCSPLPAERARIVPRAAAATLLHNNLGGVAGAYCAATGDGCSSQSSQLGDFGSYPECYPVRLCTTSATRE